MPRGTDDVLECLVNVAHNVATGATLAKFASDASWAALGLEAAADAAAVVTTTITAISVAESCKFLILMGVFMIALHAFAAIVQALGSDLTGPWSSRWNIAKIKLPQGGKSMMKSKPEDKRCTGREQRNDESPLCFTPSCSGVSEKCTMPPYTNCPCWEMLEFDVPQRINQSVLDFQQDLLKIAFTIDDNRSPPATKPSCNMSDVSAFPKVLFQNVYKSFCNEVVHNDSYHAITWIVDSSGNRIPPRKEKAQKRTPPVDLETFKDDKINLFFTLDPDTHFTCGKGCTEAFDMISNSKCGSADSHQYSMTKEANLNVGCGNYTYKIDAPPKKAQSPPPPSSISPPPSSTSPNPYKISSSSSSWAGTVTCYKPDEFGQHPRILAADCRTGARNFCRLAEKQLVNGLKPGDKPYIMEPKSSIDQVTIHYELSWVDGCTASQSSRPDGQNCEQIYESICQHCSDFSTNICIGGWREDSCLKYDFKPVKG